MKQLTYTAEELTLDTRRAVFEGSIFEAWLLDQCLAQVNGDSEFERGVCEGARRLAGLIISSAADKTEIKIETEDTEEEQEN
jgi:hypothetical protein